MAARAGTQYLEGLKSDREVYLEGDLVTDVTTHPRFALAA